MRPTRLSPVFTLIISHPLHRPGREQMIEQVRHVSELYGARLTGISEVNALIATFGRGGGAAG